MKTAAMAVLFFVSTTASLLSQQSSFPKLIGPYLGQKPPGMTPEVFAKGIVTTNINNHSPAAFSPDGTELFWSCAGEHLYILHMRLENGQWTKPQRPRFSEDLECSSPMFSVDGQKLFFTSQAVESGRTRISLWYVEKTNEGWSSRKRVESISRFGEIGYQVSFTRSHTIYFRSKHISGFGEGDIYRARLTNGEYGQPENLGATINSKHTEASPFVAPDESFLLFRRGVREEQSVKMNFYVSFHRQDDSWSEPICISEQLDSISEGFWIGL